MIYHGGGELVVTSMKSFSSFIQPLVVRIGSSKAIVMTMAKKIVFEEPARVAVSLTSGKILAFGNSAVDLAALGAPDVQVVPLFRDGLPVDLELCREYFLWMRESFTTTRLRHVLPYPVVTVVPVGFPKPYEEMFEATLRSAHFFPIGREVSLVGDAWMELGAKAKTERVVVIRIGTSQTQLASIGYGGIHEFATIGSGGEDLDRQLIRYLRRTYELSVPQSQSGAVKESYTKAQFAKSSFSIVVRGKHVKSNDVRSLALGDADLKPLYDHFFTTLATLIAESMVLKLHYSGRQSHEQIFLSGGLSLFPEAKRSIESIIGTQISQVSRPTVASLLGIVSKRSTQ